MRRPLERAVIRRDDQLSRTRRLSAWIVGWATAASLSLAGVLGIAIPGKAATAGSHALPAPSGAHAGQGNRQSGGTGGDDHASGGGAGTHRKRIAPPSAPPSSSSAPPVVSSGGS